MNDEIVIADDGVHEPDCLTDFSNVGFAPGESQWVFDAAFNSHYFQQRMIEQILDSPTNKRMEVPKRIYFDEIRIIACQHKIGIILQKQVSDVVQMNQAIQPGRGQALLFAELVTEQAGGFA